MRSHTRCRAASEGLNSTSSRGLKEAMNSTSSWYGLTDGNLSENAEIARGLLQMGARFGTVLVILGKPMKKCELTSGVMTRRRFVGGMVAGASALTLQISAATAANRK